jgi:valyl-tRNA synthetase
MHPISPFITEEIFSLLRAQFPHLRLSKNCDPYTREAITALLSPACISAPYPQVVNEADIDEESEKTFALMNELVRAVRNIRAEMQLAPSEKTELLLFGPPSSSEWKMAQKHQAILTALTPTSSLSFLQEEPSAFGASALVGPLKLMIPIPESLRAKEKARLEKEREKLEKLRESTQSKLGNDEFRARAPREVVEKLENALLQTEKQLSEIALKLHSW